MLNNNVNIFLFNFINSMAGVNPYLDSVVIALSHDLNTIFIVFLILLCFFKDKEYRFLFLKTLILVGLGLIICDVIEQFYYSPRPFALHLGHQLIGHGKTTSFPSHHTLTIAIIAFSYLMGGYRKIGGVGIVFSLIVGWSRIYVGVHYPSDIIGAFLIALILVLIVNSLGIITAPAFKRLFQIQF